MTLNPSNGFPPQFVILGNPENRRVKYFQQALKDFNQPIATVVPYVAYLQDRQFLVDALQLGSILRIESPGENFDVEKQILALGASNAEAEGCPFLTAEQACQLEYDLGLIHYPRQWYLGFRKLMAEVEESQTQANSARTLNPPSDIIEFFDKSVCHSRCLQGGVPVPEPMGPVQSFDELIFKMKSKQWSRVFVKLTHSSSASGVVALYHSSKRTRAVTSAELVTSPKGTQLYNSLKIRNYSDLEEIRDLINTLCLEGVHVEKWLPKAALNQSTTFDLRVVVINGKACHYVVRESRSPLTNLHLGNRRGKTEQLQQALTPQCWKEIKQICEQAAGLYPHSFYVGVDLLLTPGFRQKAVLELNAFGDLLPGICHKGHETYQYEIMELTSQ